MAEENGAQSVYVVMVKGDAGGFDDIATVTVAPRTKRRTIIEKALAEAGYSPDSQRDGLTLRVLDEESAREIPAAPETRPAEWKIG